MNKDIQASILRASARFIGKRLEALEPRFKALETRAMTPGPEGKKGDPGEPGAPGKSVTLDEVLPAILPEVRKAIAEIPPPRDGKDGDASGVIRELIDLLNADQGQAA